jgi:hypothetical protein
MLNGALLKIGALMALLKDTQRNLEDIVDYRVSNSGFKFNSNFIF